MEVPYAPRLVSGGWVVAGWAGVSYGVYLTVLALRSPPGTELTGHWIMQPPFKALMALLLTLAAVAHPLVRERRWLMPSLLLSATGDWLLAIPWWTLSFVAGLTAFMLAHLCFVGALLPLARTARPSPPRIAIAVLVCLLTLVLLGWFWPRLSRDDLTLPVTVYIGVLTAMVCTAQFARLPTIWAAVGALCFAASDSMFGIGRFVLHNDALAVPIWWLYAAAQILLTAGFFFGREEVADSWGGDAEAVDWPAEQPD
ncbi:lysoplasmalogenase [Mycobacterium sp. THU-M104]|uniref:lysoplasmalogenase n=1 Tax=Mycobacterium sp. THU-M104 TaxID=3410515 RepID=UPI003B9D62DF